MTIYEDTSSRPLLKLLDWIHSVDMVLPDFQHSILLVNRSTLATTALVYPFDG